MRRQSTPGLSRYAAEPLERRVLLTVFTNTNPIDIPISGTANPYPSEITVSGMSGTTTGLTVTLNDINHTWPDDIDVLLVSPTGQSVVLMSDVGGGNSVDDINITVGDGGSSDLPDNAPLVTGTYQPTNAFGEPDNFPSPAPGGAPTGTTMSHFFGADPNGTWSLYVSDAFAADQGDIEGGWSIEVTTGGGGGGDGFEPNDNFAAAPNLGTLGDLTVNGLSIHEPFNDDYFVLTTADAGTLNVDVSFTHANGDIDLFLYNGSQVQVDSSQGTGDIEQVGIPVGAGETYYIQVIGFNGATNTYDMVIDGPDTPGLPPDAFENNDSFGQAANLGVLGDRAEDDLTIDAPFDDDYYIFTAEASGTATVDLSFFHINGDIELAAYDASQTPLAGSFGTGDSEHVEFPVTAGQSYYIEVFGIGGVNTYDMVVHSPIAGQPLYALEQTAFGSRLTRVSRATGAILQRFPEQGTIQLSALAYDESTGTMFGYDHGVGLYTIHLTTGAFTLLHGSALTIHSLAIQPGTNTLFGLTLEGSLYTLNKNTGAPTLVGSDTAAIDFAHGLTFSPGGTLYASDTLGTGTSNLLTINTANGDATVVATIDRDFVVGLAFDAAGTLYGSDNGTDTLIRINTTTGLATAVGPFGIDLAHNAIEFLPDEIQPTADVVDISPDPRNSAINFATIRFSEPIDPATFTLSDVSLTRDGGGQLLSGNSLTTTDNVTWILHGLGSLTDEAGFYVLTVAPNITDPSGNSVVTHAQDTWVNHAVRGTADHDEIRLVRNANPALIDVFINNFSATPTYSVIAANLGASALHVLALEGEDSTIIDLSNGNPAPAAGLAFDGGPTEVGNTLSVYGGSGADTLTFNASTVVTNGFTTTLANAHFLFVDGDGGFDDLTVNAGSPFILDSQELSSLTIADGATARMALSGNYVLFTQALSIAPTGQLDLQDNDLVLDYDTGNPVVDIQALINSGYNFGGHDGPGIVSSAALNNDPFTFTLGYADNAFLPLPYGSTLGGGTFGGFDVDDTAVLIKFTWVGDVTLDGIFDFQDLSIFNGNYDSGATSGRLWTDGDLNFDSVIDFQDLSLFNGNYNPNREQL